MHTYGQAYLLTRITASTEPCSSMASCIAYRACKAAGPLALQRARLPLPIITCSFATYTRRQQQSSALILPLALLL